MTAHYYNSTNCPDLFKITPPPLIYLLFCAFLSIVLHSAELDDNKLESTFIPPRNLILKNLLCPKMPLSPPHTHPLKNKEAEGVVFSYF